MARKKDSETNIEQDEQTRQDAGEEVDTPDTDTESETQQIEETQEVSQEEALRQRVAELEDKLLRSAAEFENYRKRIARQYEDMVRSANDPVMLELLDIIDNFERALNHAGNNTDFESLRKGTELILNQMTSLLKKYDITPIEAIGKTFDPNLHDAMMQVESDDYDEGVVAMEMSRGYRQGDRILRHSKVGVSSGKKEKSDK